MGVENERADAERGSNLSRESKLSGTNGDWENSFSLFS